MNLLRRNIIIKLKCDKITYNDLYIDPIKSHNEQIYALKEDLIQINFENKNIVIDVGWYPEFDPKGSFTIKVIQDSNWEKPLFEKKTKNVEELYKILNEEVNKIDNLENLILESIRDE